MSANVYLTDKVTNEVYGPGCKKTMADLDTLLREKLGAEPNEKEFYLGWVDNIGMSIAFNLPMEKIDEFYLSEEREPKHRELYEYLNANYEFSNNWGDSTNHPNKSQKLARAFREIPIKDQAQEIISLLYDSECGKKELKEIKEEILELLSYR